MDQHKIISIEEVVENPIFFLYDLKVKEQSLEFVLMSRSLFRDSVFLDNRIANGRSVERFEISIEEILNHENIILSNSKPRLFIFHTAICGSTLLAKLFDHPSICLTYTEPLILYRFSLINFQDWKSSGLIKEEYFKILRICLALLSKTFSDSEIPLIKTTINCNFWMKDILDVLPNPKNKTLFLYSNLKTFLSSVLADPRRRTWAKKQLQIIALSSQAQKTLNHIFGQSHFSIDNLSDASFIACLWILQIYSYLDFHEDYVNNSSVAHTTQVRSLNCDRFFAQPAQVLTQLINFFQLSFPPNSVAAMMNSEIFNTYSKAKNLNIDINPPPFDAKRRAAILLKRQALYAEEIRQGLSWAKAITQARPIPEILPNPL